jgi:hypothetical protein
VRDRPGEVPTSAGWLIVGKSAEVIVVVATSLDKSGRTHRNSEGLNIKMFQIRLGFAPGDSPVISGTEQKE